jgi:hypothetical protein
LKSKQARLDIAAAHGSCCGMIRASCQILVPMLASISGAEIMMHRFFVKLVSFTTDVNNICMSGALVLNIDDYIARHYLQAMGCNARNL